MTVCKTHVNSEFCKFCNLISSIRMLSVSVNFLLTLWLLVFRVADHESKTILFLQEWFKSYLHQLYHGLSYLSCVIEFRNWEETTPKISIFKAFENCHFYSYFTYKNELYFCSLKTKWNHWKKTMKLWDILLMRVTRATTNSGYIIKICRYTCKWKRGQRSSPIICHIMCHYFFHGSFI